MNECSGTYMSEPKHGRKLTVPILAVALVIAIASTGFMYYQYQDLTNGLGKAVTDLGLKPSNTPAGQISTLADEIQAKRSQVASLTGTVDRLTGQVSDLTKQVNNLTQQITSLQASLDAAAKQHQADLATISSLQDQISTLQAEKALLQNQITYLNQQISSLNSQISSLNSQIDSLKSQVTSLQTQVANYKNIVQLGVSKTYIDHETISQPAYWYTYWTFNDVQYAGYFQVTIHTSTTTTTYIQVVYTYGGVTWAFEYDPGVQGSVIFPVLPGSVEVRVGNRNLISGATETVSIIYVY